MECVFCSIASESIIIQNDLAFEIYDKYPLTMGHILVISKKHFANFFDLSDEEMVAIKQLLFECKDKLFKEDKSIIGFNIRTNIGRIAGQTVMHCHFHLIPRRKNDGLGLIGGDR